LIRIDKIALAPWNTVDGKPALVLPAPYGTLIAIEERRNLLPAFKTPFLACSHVTVLFRPLLSGYARLRIRLGKLQIATI
jgi:hypothetical protein